MTNKEFCRRWQWCVYSSLLLGYLAFPVATIGQKNAPRVSEQQIETARQRGLAFIKSNARSTPKTGGRAALVAMTLLKAGIPVDDPVVQQTINEVVSRVSGTTFKPVPEQEGIYEAGVSLMALANADPEKYKPQIEVIANYIIANQGTEGDWDYVGPDRSTGDTSISQYGMLGLWEASRSGVDVPVTVWEKAAQWHITRQSADGGFTYHPSTANTQEAPTHSMSVAGSGSLLIARRLLFGAGAVEVEADPQKKKAGAKFGVLETSEEPTKTNPTNEAKAAPKGRTTKQGSIDQAIKKGIGWMNKNFTVTNPSGWPIYYLYGLERLGALADTDQFGSRDWYLDGAAHLVATQAADGSWTDQSGPDCGTCFGVLFLTKATAKMVTTTKRGPRASRFGAGLLQGGRGLPTNLKDAEVSKGQVKARVMTGDLDKLLAELENSQSQNVESAQQTIVEQIQLGNGEALIGQRDRLVKLVNDKRWEVRRTALWALGRSNDLQLAPLLIKGLSDTGQDVTVEARNALKFLSKKLNGFGYPDEPTDDQRLEEIKKWKKWYLSVRAYEERGGLDEKD
jgi:hypothetical protein